MNWLILIVEVHSIWLLKCFRSKFLFYSRSGHGFSVDYYCLGALLYELVTGNPPFYSRDVEKIYHSIQNDEIDFPPHVELSPEIKMLLEGLLIKDPKRRLGSLGGIR